ncbi:MAG: nitrilase-related carbon-nitrogen hydrolase [Thermoplasmatota archaeon]
MVQCRTVPGDVDGNLARATALVQKAAGEGQMDIVVLPEVFATGFPYEQLPELSNSSDTVIRSIAHLATDISAHIMFTLVVSEDENFFNRFISIGPAGKIEATYDKTHLFSRAGEDRFFARGDRLVLFKASTAAVAPLICYEVRFPELARKQVLDGADILVIPAQWPAFRIFQWQTLLRARAIENQCYVVGVGGLGKHGPTEMGGHSMVVGPFGEILCNLDDKEGYAMTVIGPDRIRDIRNKIPSLEERRPELY